MEKAYDSISGIDLHIFNKVQLFLRVTTISDLLTANGKKIDENILKGKRSNSPTMSEHAYTWPNIPQPTQFEILIWYNIISSMLAITQSDARIDGNSVFKWDNKASEYSKWMVSPDSKFLYEKMRGYGVGGHYKLQIKDDEIDLLINFLQ